MTPEPGEIWLADSDGEVRRLVVVISSTRFQRLAERVVIAPLIDRDPEPRPPWMVPVDARQAIAVNLLGTVPVTRLLERVSTLDGAARALVERAVRAITT